MPAGQAAPHLAALVAAQQPLQLLCRDDSPLPGCGHALEGLRHQLVPVLAGLELQEGAGQSTAVKRSGMEKR